MWVNGTLPVRTVLYYLSSILWYLPCLASIQVISLQRHPSKAHTPHLAAGKASCLFSFPFKLRANIRAIKILMLAPKLFGKSCFNSPRSFYFLSSCRGNSLCTKSLSPKCIRQRQLDFQTSTQQFLISLERWVFTRLNRVTWDICGLSNTGTTQLADAPSAVNNLC